jgi:RNA polymerase sigma factor (sigma-70 family)
MFNVSMRITNDYAEAEDVLQESFLSAFQNIHSFRGDSTFGSWLKTIVVHNALGVVRKRKAGVISIEEQDFLDDTPDSGEEGPDWQVSQVRKAIQQLPDGYRIVLSLYLLEGYDHKEIAQILEISEATSKSQYSRARKKLLEIIRGSGM